MTRKRRETPGYERGKRLSGNKEAVDATSAASTSLYSPRFLRPSIGVGTALLA
jgi:hypothetical protein